MHIPSFFNVNNLDICGSRHCLYVSIYDLVSQYVCVRVSTQFLLQIDFLQVIRTSFTAYLFHDSRPPCYINESNCALLYTWMLVLLSSIYLLCGSLFSLLCTRECKWKWEMRYTVRPIVSNDSTDWQLAVGCWETQQCIIKGILTSGKVNVNKSCFKISKKKKIVQVLCGRKCIQHMLVLKVTNIAFWFVAVNVNINFVFSQKSSIGNL